MRIWIYSEQTMQSRLVSMVQDGDIVIGFSVPLGSDAPFPQGGLTPALQAAIRGGIDLFLVSDFALLGESEQQRREWQDLFQSYHVEVRSI